MRRRSLCVIVCVLVAPFNSMPDKGFLLFIEATKGLGSPSHHQLIAYREYNASGTELTANMAGYQGEVKAGVPSTVRSRVCCLKQYTVRTTSSQHFSPAPGEYPQPSLAMILCRHRSNLHSHSTLFLDA